MSELYTLSSVDDTTPVELTGGRVGYFKFRSSADHVRLGDSGVTSSSGVRQEFNVSHDLYVTSPDEVYVVSEGTTTNIVVLHTR